MIKKFLLDYMDTKGPELGVGVDVTLTHTDDALRAMIVTQGCFLPPDFRGPRPVATEGEREGYIRQWLEINGIFSSHIPSDLSLLSCILTSTGVDKNDYKWEVREDDRDQY